MTTDIEPKALGLLSERPAENEQISQAPKRPQKHHA